MGGFNNYYWHIDVGFDGIPSHLYLYRFKVDIRLMACFNPQIRDIFGGFGGGGGKRGSYMGDIRDGACCCDHFLGSE